MKTWDKGKYDMDNFTRLDNRVFSFLFILFLVVLFLTAGVILCRLPAVNSLSTTSGSNLYVKVDELWDNSDNTMNIDNVNQLINYLSTDGSISGVQTDIAQSASDIRGYTYGGKAEGQSVVVRLGGFDWIVTYLSTSITGEKIVTLWLSNCIQDGFDNYSSIKGDYYEYINNSATGTGLYSDWAADWESTNIGSYPSSMYSTSYIRTVTLNNGGQYAINNSTFYLLSKKHQ